MIFVLLAVLGLAVFRSAKSSVTAERKADQLIAALTVAGLRAPPKDQIERVLGDDGGAVCADPNSALVHGVMNSQLSNGAGGPGTRPVIVDDRVAKGGLLIIGIYCPGKLADYQAYIDGMNYANVAKG
jgi:Tfp pilus assembly protein FimT